MKSPRQLAILSGVAVAILAATSTGLYAYALEDTEVKEPESSRSQKPETEASRDKVKNEKSSKAAKDTKKADICKKRQDNIARRLTSLNERAARHFEVIEKVYANLSRYNAEHGITLTAEQTTAVTTAHSTAQSAIDRLKTNSSTFSCDSNNFGSTASSLRSDIQTVNEALHTYRQAVKDALNQAKVQEASNDTNN